MKRKPMCREREGNCVSGREKRTSRGNKRCSVNYHLFMCGGQAYLEQDGRRGGTTQYDVSATSHLNRLCIVHERTRIVHERARPLPRSRGSLHIELGRVHSRKLYSTATSA